MTSNDDPSSTGISLRLPSKYAVSGVKTENPAFVPPSLDFLYRTWTVTHSTLSMWRTARNVRITYSAVNIKPHRRDNVLRIDDLVQYETLSGKGSVKTVLGRDTAAGDTGSWNWRGIGWLFFVTSHWEVLGWGQRPLPDGSGVERWAVTWFQATIFTQEGLDIYSDREGGISERLAQEVVGALERLDAKPLVDISANMKPVAIQLPFKKP